MSLLLHTSALGFLHIGSNLSKTLSTSAPIEFQYISSKTTTATSQRSISKMNHDTSKQSQRSFHKKTDPVAHSELRTDHSSHEDQQTAQKSQEMVDLNSGSDQSGLTLPYSYLIQLILSERIYPFESRRLKQQGQVLVAFKINLSGEIVSIELRQASEYDLLNEAALRTLQKIKLNISRPEAAQLLGKTYTFTFDYRIRRTI